MAEGTGFEVRIIQGDGKEILLDEHTVSGVTFKIDTIEEDVKDRSENVINKVVITGDIKSESKDQTRMLALWSLDKKREKVYREMVITLRPGGETLRTYHMNKVFCIDYTEEFDSHNKKGNIFTLVAAQRKDNLDGIKVGSV